VIAGDYIIETKSNKTKTQSSIHRAMARRLTFALAAAFQDYSKRVKSEEEQNLSEGGNPMAPIRKRFAIDLRTAEEIEQDSDDQETEA
jgi:hypothetical protein